MLYFPGKFLHISLGGIFYVVPVRQNSSITGERGAVGQTHQRGTKRQDTSKEVFKYRSDYRPVNKLPYKSRLKI